jgi:ATP adenylyltransferase
MEKLFSPWRLRYIVSPRRQQGCVFCRAFRGRRDRDNLVLTRGRAAFVILNKYPYNNGHLMVVPAAHLADLLDTPQDVLAELMELAVRCEAALRQVYRPTGINLGMNVGRSAGAGIEGHLHLHLVPRWDGDTNFMSVVHGTRVIPESLQTTYRRLRPLLNRVRAGRGPGAGGRLPAWRRRSPARRRAGGAGRRGAA